MNNKIKNTTKKKMKNDKMKNKPAMKFAGWAIQRLKKRRLKGFLRNVIIFLFDYAYQCYFWWVGWVYLIDKIYYI